MAIEMKIFLKFIVEDFTVGSLTYIRMPDLEIKIKNLSAQL